MFSVSYNELLVEVNRREAVQKRHQMVIEFYRRELNAMYQMESEKREMFFESFGRFLPQSMIETLVPLPKYQIYSEKPIAKMPMIVKPPNNSTQTNSMFDSFSSSEKSNQQENKK